MEWLLEAFPNIALIFCRITAFFVVAPVFSARNVPVPFKIGFSFFLALLISPAVAPGSVGLGGEYALSIVKETLIGVLLGFIAYLFFTVVQISGSFIDMQIGFSMANIIDPMTGAQTPVLGNLKFTLATLLFLAFNGHHVLISAILDSYRWVPLDNDLFARIYGGQVSTFLIHSLSSAFSLAFQMAAPLVVTLFLVDVGLGILARTAPQFNIFVVGVPIKVLVGLLMLGLLVAGYPTLFADLFQEMFREIQNMVGRLSGG